MDDIFTNAERGSKWGKGGLESKSWKANAGLGREKFFGSVT